MQNLWDLKCYDNNGFQFPGFKINVRGEEDGSFPSQDGHHVKLEITDDIQNTR
jgi:hypothetical protein